MSLSADMMAKRAALATTIKTVLDAHGYGTFVVDERVRQALIDAIGDIDRDSIMQDPIRYVRVAHVGNENESEQHMTAFGAVAQCPHQFAVFIWFEYADAATYANSSQKKFDDLLESHGANDGLLFHLRSIGVLEVSGFEVYVNTPTEVIVPDEPLHMSENIFAHYCQFFITLT